MFLWAIYTIVLRGGRPGCPPPDSWQPCCCFGLPLLLPFYLWELFTRGGFAVSIPAAAALAYYGTLPSIVAYLFWNRGRGADRSEQGGTVRAPDAVFGALLSVIFLGEAAVRLPHRGRGADIRGNLAHYAPGAYGPVTNVTT